MIRRVIIPSERIKVFFRVNGKCTVIESDSKLLTTILEVLFKKLAAILSKKQKRWSQYGMLL